MLNEDQKDEVLSGWKDLANRIKEELNRGRQEWVE